MSYLFLETNRLIVRQWEPDDTTALWKIMSDSRMHCYTGDVPWTLLRTAEYIRFMANRNFRSLDLFHGACILKQGQTLIGLTGLNPYQLKRPEIEWQLGVSHWGNGYATEIGQAVINNAFATTEIEAIYGMVSPHNKASIRVMENIGMIFIGIQDFHGKQDMFYKIDRTNLFD